MASEAAQQAVSIDLRHDRPGRVSGRAIPLPLLLTVALGGALLCGLGLLVGTPNTFADEFVYIELAKSFGNSGHFDVMGISFPAWTYGPAYAVFLSPIFRFAATARDAYTITRCVDAFLFASAAFPAFLVARRSVSRRSALIIGAAAIALPASVYTTKVMTESLAYPAALWCVLAALRVIERHSKVRQMFLVLSVAVTSLIRFELLALGPALALACVLCGEGPLRRRTRELSLVVLGALATLVAAGWLVYVGSHPNGAASPHGSDVSAFSMIRFARLLVGSVGAVDLYGGVVPFACCMLVLAAVGKRAHWVSRELRATTVAACIAGGALVVVGSVYLATVPAVAQPPIPADRYAFYIVPLLLVCFAGCIEAKVTLSMSVGGLAFACALPLAPALLNVDHHPHGTMNGFAFLPWVVAGGGSGPVVALLIAIYCCLCFYLLRAFADRMDVLVKPVLGIVTVSTVCAFFFVLSGKPHSPKPGWLDAHAGSPVIAVWTSGATAAEAQGLWEIAVANRDLSRVYFLRKPDSFGAQVGTEAVRTARGVLLAGGRPVRVRWVLTTRGTPVTGTRVATSHGFTIYRVVPPVRLDR